MSEGVRRNALPYALLLALWLDVAGARAAEGESGRFGTQTESLAFPSAARVMGGFAITVLIAGGLALGLRKAWPLFSTRMATSTSIRPLSRATVSRTLTVHLVEVDGVRVVMAEGRGAIGMTVLPAVAINAARDSNA